ncbi:hypothetical protein ABTJ80_19705, partial [Acinetobacter baumannii]
NQLPVRTGGGVWFTRFRAGDRENELTLQLSKRMRRHGVQGDWKRIDTVDDFIRAWCGQKPKTR